MEQQDHYFALFGLKPDFDVDEEELRQKYIKLQRQVHPDKFAAADSMQRELAMKQAADINRGYDTLKNPIKRARYLLLTGSGVDALGEQTIDNNAFLMEQMQWRESLEQIGDDPEEAVRMAKKIAEEQKKMYTQFGEIWKGCGNGQHFPKPNEEQTEQLTELAQRMRYLDKLSKELAELPGSVAQT